MSEIITGTLRNIYRIDQNNGYSILTVETEQESITALGSFTDISKGEKLILTGDWNNHPRHGRQFKVASYEIEIPSDKKAIERYLGSGLIKGIGPALAKRLVDKFGEQTLEIIEQHPERLKEVPDIGDKRIAMIKIEWDQHALLRNIRIFLLTYDISPTHAAKIYKKYGMFTIATIKENPYALAEDIHGIGFLTADKMAINLGFDRNSKLRAESGILYVLNDLSEKGNTCYPISELITEAKKLLEIDDDIIISALQMLAEADKVIIEETGYQEKTVYLRKYQMAEVSIAKKLKELVANSKDLDMFNADKALTWVQNELNISLAEKQQLAIREASMQKVMIVSGGPGTGKTTIISSIIKIFNRLNKTVLLAAPTGRAAKRMTDATGMEAKTIHRLLEYSPRDHKFQKNEYSQLDADLIIADEMSMMDTNLTCSFLKAIPTKACLILVGDVDQLPSVGPGNILKDIIASNIVKTIYLDEIFRQAKKSMIVVNAHLENNGAMPLTKYDKDDEQDFFFFNIEDPAEILKSIIDLCKNRIPAKFGFNPLKDIQVLSPMHKGTVGTLNLNTEMQSQINNSTEELIIGFKKFKCGDKVMQVKNNYEKSVYNGDIGVLKSFNRGHQEVTVEFDDKEIQYKFGELDELILAWAASIHKSQGSEYPVVVIPVSTQHYILLQKNLIYTAITRGKKLVVLVGTKKALAIAVKNNKQQMRYTGLAHRLAA